MEKKSNYRIIAEAIAFGGMDKANLPVDKVACRKLTVDEIKECILEEFGKAKDAEDEDVQDPIKGWGDAELCKEIEWIKELDLKEFLKK
jgi:hypothetical protein